MLRVTALFSLIFIKRSNSISMNVKDKANVIAVFSLLGVVEKLSKLLSVEHYNT